MAPAKVGDSDVLKIWWRMNNIKTRVVKPKYNVGQHVRISKEKMHFAKGAEQNNSTEIFRVPKVIKSLPRPVYELQDLNDTPILASFIRRSLYLFVSRNGRNTSFIKSCVNALDMALGKCSSTGLLPHRLRLLDPRE
jgi:hypothetical protein